MMSQLFFCKDQKEDSLSPIICDSSQVELVTQRIAWSDKNEASLELRTPDCLKDKMYQVTLIQDDNLVSLDPRTLSEKSQSFTWSSDSLKMFRPGLVQVGISLEKTEVKSSFLSLYHPAPFQSFMQEKFPIGELLISYLNYGPVALGFSNNVDPDSRFTLFALSKNSFDSDSKLWLDKFVKMGTQLQLGFARPNITYNLKDSTTLAAITNANKQDPSFFYAIPNTDIKDQNKSYFLYKLPENSGNSLEPFLVAKTKISSLAEHAMLVIDHQGTMAALGDSNGNLEVYHFINNMVFPVKVSKFVKNAVFLTIGVFQGTGNQDLPDVLVLDQEGSVFVLPYEKETQSLGEPIVIAQTASQFPLGSVSAVAVGDIDQDGLLDLALASGQTIKFLLHQGKDASSQAGFSVKWADFQVQTNILVHALLIGDLNQDGKNDIVVTDVSTSSQKPNTNLQVIYPQ